MCILFHLWKSLKYYVNNRWMSSNFSDDPEIYMLANLVPYLSTTRRVEMWRECSDQRIFPFIKMTTSELLSHGMSLLSQNIVGSTNVGALPLLSKIGKVRVLCLQILPLQIVLNLQCLLSTCSNRSLFAMSTIYLFKLFLVCNVYYLLLQIILYLRCLPVQIIFVCTVYLFKLSFFQSLVCPRRKRSSWLSWQESSPSWWKKGR